MNMIEALENLGAHDGLLTSEEKAKLDRDGFLRLRHVLTADHVARINQRLDELLQEEGAEAGKEVHQEAGTDRLADLVNKGPMFHPMIVNPRVLAAVAHVLEGDVKLTTLNSRAALPGQGHQAFHMDWGDPELPPLGRYEICNTMWLLDDFTTENGATRIVPGSHRFRQQPDKVMPDPKAAHPDEVLALGEAGDVVVFNSHCWHSGTLNRTNKPRRGITAAYVRRTRAQMTDQRKHLRPQTRAALSEAALFLMDAV